jgi:biopolymer transport protein ExbD
MSRRTIDMLPLLDVFMVVLFVFATIQEGTAREIEGEANEREAQANERVAAAERDQRAAERRAASNGQALEALRKQLAATESTSTLPPRVSHVLDRLLEKATVVEIEIVGSLGKDGELGHACCFRSDPRQATFSSCGPMPSDPADIERWLETDGAALGRALRATGGGAALTLIRQDPVAAYRIGARFGDTVRRLFPDRQVYAEAPREMVAMCASTTVRPQSPSPPADNIP